MSGESWRKFEVVLTGAFLTGTPLLIPVGEASRMQAFVGDELRKQHPHGAWRYEPLTVQDPGGSYDGAGGYPSLVPLVLVHRAGRDLLDALSRELDALHEEARGWLGRATEGWRWQVHDVSIDVYDFGAGVLRCAVNVEPPAGMPISEVRDHIVRLSRTRAEPEQGVETPMASALEALTRETAAQFASLLRTTRPDAVQPPWAQPIIDAIGAPDEVSAEPGAIAGRSYGWGALLWLHPLLVLEAPAHSRRNDAHEIAEPFRSDFYRSIDTHYGLFEPGIEISVMVGRKLQRARETMLLWISMNWAYYAIFMEIDRGLFARLDAARRDRESSISHLERDAREMFEHHLRVESVKTRLQSILMDMGGGALALWETVAEGQRLNALIQTVDAKLVLLRGVSERRLREATAGRDRRISAVLYLLSAMTAISVVADVIATLIGSPNFPSTYLVLRYGATGAAFVVAVALFLIGNDWRPTRKTRR